MLMNGDAGARMDFLTRITLGSVPAFKLTYTGDPERQEHLKATLPNIFNTFTIEERSSHGSE